MTEGGKVTEDVEESDEREREHERELRKMWRPMDVFGAIVVTVFVFVALWIGVSSGVDSVQIGHSSCVFTHEHYSHMDLQCGTASTGNSGGQLSNVGASIINPG